MAFGQLAPDMPEFLEIVGGRVLSGFDAERRVTARAALAGMIFALGFIRQREEQLRLPFRLGDDVGGNAVIGDDGEAVRWKDLPSACAKPSGSEASCARETVGTAGFSRVVAMSGVLMSRLTKIIR